MGATMWILVFSASTAVLLAPVTAVCPYNVETCTCTGTSLVCRNLNGIPALASDNKDGRITDLTFKSCKLKNITGNSLPANLHSLTLSNVNASSISSDAFSSSADTLKSLSMSKVNFSDLPYALLKVNSLTELTLIDVTFNTRTPDILHQLGQTLRSVVFENVGLTYWPEWLNDFTLLNSADLSRNRIHSIPADAFSKLQHLTNLSLASNLLGDRSEMNAALRSLNGTLQRLNISDNIFNVIPQALAGMSQLSKLDISFNLIKEVTSDRIPSQLTELDLSRNYQLRGLNDSSFPNASSLEVLILSRTGITSIFNFAFQPLKHLRILYLDGSDLAEIPLALTKLHNLKILNMNAMTYLKCSCPRDDELVNWFQSQKSLKIFGYCDINKFTIKNYLTNTTGNSPCSGNSPVASSHILYYFPVVAFGVLFVLFLSYKVYIRNKRPRLIIVSAI